MNRPGNKLSSLLLTITIALFSYNTASAQHFESKKLLDTNAIDHWTSVSTPAISNNGKFAGYVVQTGFYGKGELCLKALDDNWNKQIKNTSQYAFTADNKEAVVLAKDTLHIITLGRNKEELIPSVNSFTLLSTGKKQRLLYTTAKGGLVVIDRPNQTRHKYNAVLSWKCNDHDPFLTLIEKQGDLQAVICIDLKRFTETQIGKFKNIDGLTTGNHCRKIAFLSENEPGKNIINYCRIENLEQQPIVRKFETDDKQVAEIEKFSDNGELLFVKIVPPALKIAHPSNLTVWSYLDIKLKSQERKDKGAGNMLSSINLETGKLIQIERANEHAESLDRTVNNLFVLTYNPGDSNESQWNLRSSNKYKIYDPINDVHKEIPFLPLSVSPDGQYIVGFRDKSDIEDNELVSYNIRTEEIAVIMKSLEIKSAVNRNLFPIDREGYSFVGWQGHSLLLYDDYDIWKLNIHSPDKLIGITNGYGRSHHISFRFANEIKNDIVSEGDMKLLSALDNFSKETGFYKLPGEKEGVPFKLCMEQRFFDSPAGFHNWGFHPLKANNTPVWIVSIEKSSSSQNYYFTKDFKNFKPISSVYPEHNYEWMTSELINFKTTSGKQTQAIVYKPENFDSKKRYPVIINYYETFSHKFDTFLRPELSANVINIPWFVERGYIVCTPDIIYSPGETGKSALETVVGLAENLSGKSYVDSAHIGIQGHSFGGYETNYIITHSKRFAAAVSAAGFADLISDANSIRPDYGGNFPGYRSERGQGRLGHSLWQRPDIYINNSPIFAAEQVNTPLLMMANPNDGAVDFSKGLEFFIALRKLGKKVWMLEYHNENHSLGLRKNQLDYTQRLEQFFGHYLKGDSAPNWMTKSIPLHMDDRESMKPDLQNKTPGSGLVYPEQMRKIDECSKTPLKDKLKDKIL